MFANKVVAKEIAPLNGKITGCNVLGLIIQFVLIFVFATAPVCHTAKAKTLLLI